jgi:gluconolactonase
VVGFKEVAGRSMPVIKRGALMRNVMCRILIWAVLCLLLASIGCGRFYSGGNTTMKLEDIISPGTQAVLEYDGNIGRPPLVMSEGASWMNSKLFFTNINFGIEKYAGSGMWILDPRGKCEITKENVFLVGTTPLGNGNLAACHFIQEGEWFIGCIAEVTPKSEIVKIIADSCDGLPFSTPNDLTTDSRGGLYFTDRLGGKIGPNKQGTAVYYVNARGKVIRLTEWNEYSFPNGCVVSADNTKFFLDDETETVWVFDIKDDGSLFNKRPFAKLFVPGKKIDENAGISMSDGMEIDQSGNLFVTSALGVQIFNRKGSFLGIIEFPKFASNLAFGGDDLSILYATCKDRIYSIQTKTRGYRYPIK